MVENDAQFSEDSSPRGDTPIAGATSASSGTAAPATTSSQNNEIAEPRDKFDAILYKLACKASERLGEDLEGLKATSDSDRVKAKLRCEEDCQLLAQIWKIRSDNDTASFTTSILNSLKEQQDAKKHYTAIALVLLAFFMVAGVVVAVVANFSNAYQVIFILFGEALCAGFAFLLLRNIIGTNDSDANISQILDTLVAIRKPNEKSTTETSKEEVILELASKLFPDN